MIAQLQHDTIFFYSDAPINKYTMSLPVNFVSLIEELAARYSHSENILYAVVRAIVPSVCLPKHRMGCSSSLLGRGAFFGPTVY